jgi:hypothetical protein
MSDSSSITANAEVVVSQFAIVRLGARFCDLVGSKVAASHKCLCPLVLNECITANALIQGRWVLKCRHGDWNSLRCRQSEAPEACGVYGE